MGMVWWLVIGFFAIMLGHGSLLLTAVLFVIGVAPLYWISLHRHPFRTCRTCKGTGRHRGGMFTWGQRACTRCGGDSRHRRWGVQGFHGSPGKQTWGERKADEADQRRGAPR